MTEDELKLIRERIAHLVLEHRDLDDVIMHLSMETCFDQLKLRRLKNRKLYIKDMISKFESMLIPDMPA